MGSQMKFRLIWSAACLNDIRVGENLVCFSVCASHLRLATARGRTFLIVADIPATAVAR